ncbi:MAG: hypothetical protein AAGE80_05710 [Pseudomonadota bacterium]
MPSDNERRSMDDVMASIRRIIRSEKSEEPWSGAEAEKPAEPAPEDTGPSDIYSLTQEMMEKGTDKPEDPAAAEAEPDPLSLTPDMSAGDVEAEDEEEPLVLGGEPEDEEPLVLGDTEEEEPLVLGDPVEDEPLVLGDAPEEGPLDTQEAPGSEMGDAPAAVDEPAVDEPADEPMMSGDEPSGDAEVADVDEMLARFSSDPIEEAEPVEDILDETPASFDTDDDLDGIEEADEAEEVPLDEPTGTDVAPVEPSTALAAAAPASDALALDEAALESMIKRVIQDELMGEIGSNISANVQRMIEMEVERRLAERKD